MIKQAEAISEMGTKNLPKIQHHFQRLWNRKKTYQPNEKLDHQWQPKKLKRTKKERKKKKKENFQHVYPSIEKKEKLVVMLESDVTMKEENPLIKEVKEEQEVKIESRTWL